jgi:hypothetical protein
MELHVRRVILSNKMPIVLIAVEGTNKNLVEFGGMRNNVFDILVESTDPRSKDIGDRLAEDLLFVTREVDYTLDVIDNDDSEEEMAYRLGAVISRLRSLRVQRAMIITHKKVINSWDPNMNANEWDAISM